jgi:hypothetical protein
VVPHVSRPPRFLLIRLLTLAVAFWQEMRSFVAQLINTYCAFDLPILRWEYYPAQSRHVNFATMRWINWRAFRPRIRSLESLIKDHRNHRLWVMPDPGASLSSDVEFATKRILARGRLSFERLTRNVSGRMHLPGLHRS